MISLFKFQSFDTISLTIAVPVINILKLRIYKQIYSYEIMFLEKLQNILLKVDLILYSLIYFKYQYN